MFKKLFSPLVDGISAALAMSGLFGLLHMCGLLDDRVSAAWATGSLGASMVLFISCPESKLTTPRAAILGNVGSAWIGMGCAWCFDGSPRLAAIAAVTLACVFMASADVRHPPGGATALLAVVGGEPIARMGWLYPMCPIFLGTCWLLLIASLRRHVSRSLERGSETISSNGRHPFKRTHR